MSFFSFLILSSSFEAFLGEWYAEFVVLTKKWFISISLIDTGYSDILIICLLATEFPPLAVYNTSVSTEYYDYNYDSLSLGLEDGGETFASIYNTLAS